MHTKTGAVEKRRLLFCFLSLFFDFRAKPCAMLDFVKDHWIEIFGTLSGLLYIYLSIREKAALWIVGFLTSAAYVYVFYKSKFYADMGLQVYYLVISIYGLYYWLKGGKTPDTGQDDKVPVRRTDLKLGLILFGVFIVLFVLMGYVLDRYTDSPVPWWDAFTTAASIIATWMLARKLIEQWLIWIVVDTVSMGLYIVKGLYPTSFLFAVYTLLAIVGYFQWLKSLRRTDPVFNP